MCVWQGRLLALSEAQIDSGQTGTAGMPQKVDIGATARAYYNFDKFMVGNGECPLRPNVCFGSLADIAHQILYLVIRDVGVAGYRSR